VSYASINCTVAIKPVLVQSGLTGIQQQCWDNIDVSSGSFRKEQLTDGNKHTYWESSGHTGSHWIRVYVKKNIVIRYVSVCVFVCSCISKISMKIL